MSAPAPKRPPGAAWCARYPGSDRLEDLAEPFRSGAIAFMAALAAGVGHPVHQVMATWRPAERAYLMHWACMIANSGQDPAEVPAMAGVPIDWTAAGDVLAARAGCKAMVRGYGIAFPAALASRHTQRRAFDARIVIPPRPVELYRFRDAKAQTWMFGGEDLPSLYKFGATFGVMKLQSDPPHWSDDGH